MYAVVGFFEVDVVFVERYFVSSGCGGDCASHEKCVDRTEALGEAELRVVDVLYVVDEVVVDVKECLLEELGVCI